MADAIARDLLDRGKAIFEHQQRWRPLWQELCWQFYPTRADFLVDHSWGEEFASHLFDDGPVVMRRDLCNAFASMLRPVGHQWFAPSVSDDRVRNEPGVKRWFDFAGKVQRRFMYDGRAQFVRCTKVLDHDFGTIGNGVGSVEPRPEGGLVYRGYHPRDCAWAENAYGEVDTMHRDMQLTARQICQRWGEKNLHQAIKDALKKHPEKKFPVRHVMIPTKDYEYLEGAQGRKYRRFAFASVYIDRDHAQVINEAGSHDFRYIVPRWQLIDGSPYAVSPATIDSLSSARMLQTMARTGNEALEKSVDPPAKVTEEAVRGDINLMAGGLTWVDRDYDERRGSSMELFEVGKNAILALQSLDAARMRMADSMYVSKLNLPRERGKTAYETSQLVEENLRATVPLFEPVKENYNTLLLDATFSILLRNGAFGSIEDMPEALRRHGEFEWSFDNPLEQAIERVKVQSFQTMMALTSVAAEADQSVIHNIDVPTAHRETIEAAGVPASWLAEKDQAQQAIATARAAAQAKQAAAEVIGGAQGAGDAATAVGEGLARLKAGLGDPLAI